MQGGFRAQQDKTPFDKAAQAFARTRLGGWLFVNVFPVIDRRLIPLTGGRLTVAVGQPILLLHTCGARSGQPRSTPLLYTRHGDGYVIVASKAGADHHPAWYYNLRAHPDAVAIEVGGRRIPVHSREAEGAEREELWRLVNDNYNGYQVYGAGRPADHPGCAARTSVTARRPPELHASLTAVAGFPLMGAPPSGTLCIPTGEKCQRTLVITRHPSSRHESARKCAIAAEIRGVLKVSGNCGAD